MSKLIDLLIPGLAIGGGVCLMLQGMPFFGMLILVIGVVLYTNRQTTVPEPVIIREHAPVGA